MRRGLGIQVTDVETHISDKESEQYPVVYDALDIVVEGDELLANVTKLMVDVLAEEGQVEEVKSGLFGGRRPLVGRGVLLAPEADLFPQ